MVRFYFCILKTIVIIKMQTWIYIIVAIIILLIGGISASLSPTSITPTPTPTPIPLSATISVSVPAPTPTLPFSNIQTSPVFTCTVTGGTGSYTYVWTQTGGSSVVSYTVRTVNTNSASFTATLQTGPVSPSTISCTVTDSFYTGISTVATTSYTWKPYYVLSSSISGGSPVTLQGSSQTSGVYTCTTTGGTDPTNYRFDWTITPSSTGSSSHVITTPNASSTTVSVSNLPIGMTTSKLTCTTTDIVAGISTSSFVTITWQYFTALTASITSTPLPTPTSFTKANQTSALYTCLVQGGSGTFSYAWSSTSGTVTSPTSSATTLSITVQAGPETTSILTCIATDTISGATIQKSVTVTWAPYYLAVTSSITSSGTPAVTLLGPATQSGGSYTCTASNGSGSYTYAWSAPSITGLLVTIASPFATTTSVQATVPVGPSITMTLTCTVTDTITKLTSVATTTVVWQPYYTSLLMSIIATPVPTPTSFSNANQLSGLYTCTVSGGSSQYSYSWTSTSGTVTTPTLSSTKVSITVPVGPATSTVLTCTVTDTVNGAIAQQSVSIPWTAYYLAMISSITGVNTPVSTFLGPSSQSGGTYTCSVSNGSGSYTYSWSAPSITGLVVTFGSPYAAITTIQATVPVGPSISMTATCTITDTVTKLTSVATITVVWQPYYLPFTTQITSTPVPTPTFLGPASQTSPSYTCVTTGGSGQASYSWSVSGGSVSVIQVVSPTLATTTVTATVLSGPATSTTLTCVATDIIAKTTSTSTVTITWQPYYPPLTAQLSTPQATPLPTLPTTTSGPAQQTSSLYTCTPSGGSGQWSYVWSFTNGSNISSYTITSPIPSQAYVFATMVIGQAYPSTLTCTVTDTVSKAVITTSATLNWLPTFNALQASITSTPIPTPTLLGTQNQTSATYTCTSINGSGPFTFVWSTTGTPATIATPTTLATSSSTSLSVTLTTTGISLTELHCTVTDQGTGWTFIASTTVYWQPYYLTLAASFSTNTPTPTLLGTQTQSRQLTVLPTNGSGNVTYQWSISGGMISGFQISAPPISTPAPTQLITSSATVTITATVLPGPETTSTVQCVVLDANGMTVTITTPITWQPYYTPIVASIQSPIQPTPTLLSTQSQTSGTYTCVATGGTGNFSYQWNVTPNATGMSSAVANTPTVATTTVTATLLPGPATTSQLTCTITDNTTKAVYTTEPVTSTWQPYYLPVSVSITESNKPTPTLLSTSTQTSALYTSTVTGGSGSVTYLWTITPSPTPTGATAGSFVIATPTASSTTVQATVTAGISATSVLTCTVTDSNGEITSSSTTVRWQPYYTALSATISVPITPTPTFLGSQTQTSGTYTCNPTGGSGNVSYQWAVIPSPTPTGGSTSSVVANTSTEKTTTITAILTPGTAATSILTCTVTDNVSGSIFTTPATTVTWQPYYSPLVAVMNPVSTPTPTLLASSSQSASFQCVVTSGGSGTFSYTWSVSANTNPTPTPSTGAIGMGTTSSLTVTPNGSNATVNATLTPGSSTSSTVMCIVTDTINKDTYITVQTITWQPYYTPLTTSIIQQNIPTPTLLSTQTQTLTYICSVTGGTGHYSYAWTTTPTPTPIGATTTSISLSNASNATTSVTATVTTGTSATTTLTCVVTDTVTQATSTSTSTITWQPYYTALGATITTPITPTPTFPSSQTQTSGVYTCHPTGGSGMYTYEWTAYASPAPTGGTTSSLVVTTSTQKTTTVTAILTSGSAASSILTCKVTDTISGATFSISATITWQAYYSPLTAVMTTVSSPTPTLLAPSTQSASFQCAVTEGGSGNYSYSWTVSPNPSSTGAGTMSVLTITPNGSNATVNTTLTPGSSASASVTCLVTDIASTNTYLTSQVITWQPYYTALGASLVLTATPTPTLLSTATQTATIQCNATGGSSSYRYTWSVTPVPTPTPTPLLTGKTVTATTSSVSVSPTGISTSSSATVTVTVTSGSSASTTATCLVSDQITGATITATQLITWQPYYPALTSSIIPVSAPTPTLLGPQNQTLTFTVVPFGGTSYYSYAWSYVPDPTPTPTPTTPNPTLLQVGTASSIAFGSATFATTTVSAVLSSGTSATSQIKCTITDTVNGDVSVSTYQVKWAPYYPAISGTITAIVTPTPTLLAPANQTATFQCNVLGGSGRYVYTWTIS
jgi:hypothetical protein